MDRIQEFSNFHIGMFVHFGLYSIVGKGEWYMHNEDVAPKEYESLMKKFKVKRGWMRDIIKVAKSFGAKYIVLTTRHHDGFSLYDTKGLSEFDVMHTPTGRDLIKEFVDECNKNDIRPFFYHTLIDWHDERFAGYKEEYFHYLFKSIQLLCKNYGRIGGFWFDGTWSNDNADWHLDSLFTMIRNLQPQAIIVNNGGQEHPGQIIHKEIDCIEYERSYLSSSPQKIDNKQRAKEICETLNRHWGYTKTDDQYKDVKLLKEIYVKCQNNGVNLLLNVGPLPNGKVRLKEKRLLKRFNEAIKNEK